MAKRGPKKYAILIDLGVLKKALTVGAPGNLFRYIRHGIRVGFGGPAKHSGGGKATIRDIAVFHDQGEGRLPRRQILHKPDRAFKKMMLKTLGKGIDGIGGKHRAVFRGSGFDMRRFSSFVTAMKRGGRPGDPLGNVYKQWGVRYLAWIKRGFVIKSRGGTFEGVKWPKLATGTIAGRRRGK